MHRVLGCTVGGLSSISLLETLVEEAVQAVDEATLGRLRRAIAAEDGDEEEQQLNGVLRMLGTEIPDETQIPLFGKAPAGQAPKP
jgi:hypothetical protein